MYRQTPKDKQAYAWRDRQMDRQIDTDKMRIRHGGRPHIQSHTDKKTRQIQIRKKTILNQIGIQTETRKTLIYSCREEQTDIDKMRNENRRQSHRHRGIRE